MESDHLCSHCRRLKSIGSPERELEAGKKCVMCGVRISSGPDGRDEISVSGTNHLHVLAVTQGIYKKHDPKPLHTLITHWSFWFGTLLVLSGVLVTILGFTGATEISLFGQTIKSANVGITMGFLGVLSVARNIKNVLRQET